MSLRRYRISASLLGALLLSSAAFAQVSVPHEFQAGTPARAAQVNENFEALANSVEENVSTLTSISEASDSNAAAIERNSERIAAASFPELVDGNGRLVGTLVGLDDSDFSVSYVTPKGFIVSNLSLTTGLMAYPAGSDEAQLYFSTSDCSGPLYSRFPPGFVFVGETGSREGLGSFQALYYVDAGREPVRGSQLWRWLGAGGPDIIECIPVPERDGNFWPVTPNDPGVTGVAESQVSRPILIRRN